MSECPHSTLLHFDNFTQGTPRAEIAKLRKKHKIVWQEDEYARGGHWLVLRRDEIDKVLRTPTQFTSNYGPLLEEISEEALPELGKSMTFQDPPIHKQHRSLADYAFRPATIEPRVPEMRKIAKGLIDLLPVS